MKFLVSEFENAWIAARSALSRTGQGALRFASRSGCPTCHCPFQQSTGCGGLAFPGESLIAASQTLPSTTLFRAGGGRGLSRP